MLFSYINQIIFTTVYLFYNIKFKFKLKINKLIIKVGNKLKFLIHEWNYSAYKNIKYV